MTRAAKWYFASVVLAGGSLLVWAVVHPSTSFLPTPILWLIAVSICLLSYYSLDTTAQNHSKIAVDVSEIGIIFLIPTMGYQGILPIVAAVWLADILSDRWKRKRPIQWHGGLFNVALFSISYVLATTCYVHLAGMQLQPYLGTVGVFNTTMAGLVYYLSGVLVLVPMVSLTSRRSVRQVLAESYSHMVWLQLIAILIAGIAAHLWFTEPLLLLIPASLVAFTYYTLTLVTKYHHLTAHLHELVAQRTAELESTLERLQAIQVLSAREVINAVHDVKNEIVHVRGLATELRVEGRLHESLMTVEHLVEDMLLASALKEPQFRLFPQVENMIRVITPVIRDIPKGDASIFMLTTCHDTQVFIDARRIKRVLRNILNNSFKYGASHVDIDLSDGEQCLIVTIRDNGQGIDPQLLATVKQRFVANQLSDGYGIGLHAAAALMSRSGGWLTIESAGEGCGTTVQLGFPRPEVSTVPPVPEHPDAAESSSVGVGVVGRSAEECPKICSY